MNGTTAVAPDAAGHPPDHDLVAAVRRGDDRAFEALYQRYHPRIAAYVRGMVKDHGRAEDVTQEVFFSSLRRMRETERPIAFKPWIYEIARNACIDLFRRTSRAEELSYDHDAGLASEDYRHLVSSGPTPDAAVDAKQQLDHLRGAFGGLSETHHQILVLRELEGLSYREIGERLGMSRPAVESTLFRARRRLTEEYDELVSGRRCQRVQAIMAEAAEGMLGARDKRRLARHLSYCQVCRREARVMGVEPAARPRTTVAAKLAALLPIPAFLRRGRGGDSPASGSGQGTFAAQLSAMSPMAEQAATTWTKAVAAVATLAVATVGAGVATHQVTGLSIPGLDRIPLVKDLAGGDDNGGGAAGSASGSSSGAGGAAAADQSGSGGSGSGSATGSGAGGSSGGATSTTGSAGSASAGSVGDSVGSATGSLPQTSGSAVPNVGVPKVDSGGGGGGGGGTNTPTVEAPSTHVQTPSTDTGRVDLPSSTVKTPTVSVPDTSSSLPDTSSTSTPTLPSLGK